MDHGCVTVVSAQIDDDSRDRCVNSQSYATLPSGYDALLLQKLKNFKYDASLYKPLRCKQNSDYGYSPDANLNANPDSSIPNPDTALISNRDSYAKVELPTPVTCCQYHHRSLNPKKVLALTLTQP